MAQAGTPLLWFALDRPPTRDNPVGSRGHAPHPGRRRRPGDPPPAPGELPLGGIPGGDCLARRGRPGPGPRGRPRPHPARRDDARGRRLGGVPPPEGGPGHGRHPRDLPVGPSPGRGPQAGPRARRHGVRHEAVRPRPAGPDRPARARRREAPAVGERDPTMIEGRLVDLIGQAVDAARAELSLTGEPPEVELSRPKHKRFGDFTANVALVVASSAGRPPREVAEAVVGHLPPDDLVTKVEVAGPGFINLWVSQRWLHDVLRRIVAEDEAYGRGEATGRSVQVEFVSANPTGPLHVGHARNAVLGDAIANVLAAAGERVEREYYYNDTGRQMELFALSVEARYLERLGRPS